jgi:hypothetical protein
MSAQSRMLQQIDSAACPRGAGAGAYGRVAYTAHLITPRLPRGSCATAADCFFTRCPELRRGGQPRP